MTEIAGWSGRILAVDLETDNPLMFLNGPLAGTNAPAAGRTTVCSLAPQSWPKPWFSRASMGGDLGHAIKAAGLDGIVITGRAPRPVYLAVQDDDVSLVDAVDLWSRGIMETQEALRKRYGRRVRVASIGPAGETLSRIASIGINEGSAAGQCGFGAVMGSKNLKAVAVLGTGRPQHAHTEALRDLIRGIAKEYTQDRENRSRRGRWPMRPGGRSHACSRGCLFPCAMRFEDVPGSIHPERTYSGVSQCTAHRFPGFEGHLWDLGFEAGFELNIIANDWGINHWDLLKGLFPWIGICHQEGLLPDIGGRAVEPDDPRFWYDVLEAIATREGPMADIVADGGWRAIQRTGLLPEPARQLYTGWGYANHWDGRGPRGNYIVYPFWLASALMWMVDTRDPMGSAHGYVQNMMGASPFGQDILSWEQLQALGERFYGSPGAMGPYSDGEGKAEAALFSIHRSLIKDSLPVCDRVFPRLFTTTSEDGLPRIEGIEGPDLEARLLYLATGLEVSSDDLDDIAERALALERVQQNRDYGRTRKDEEHVLRFFCETYEERPNPLLGERRRADPALLEDLARHFYSLRGWDPVAGQPTADSLRRLGLACVAEEG